MEIFNKECNNDTYADNIKIKNSNSDIDLFNIPVNNSITDIKIKYQPLSLSIIDSISHGSIAKSIRSDTIFNKFLFGDINIYNMKSQLNFLNLNKTCIYNNTIDAFSSFIMAKNATEIFKSRIGISILGLSLSLEDKNNIFYICLYDSINLYNKIYTMDYTNFLYKQDISKKSRRSMQYNIKNKITFDCKKIFYDYCLFIENDIGLNKSLII